MRSDGVSKRATIADVAALAGTSKSTVSFVLNDRPGVAPATRDRVLAAVADLDWRPNRSAQQLSRLSAGAIGIVFARTPETLRFDPFFAPFLAGVEHVVSAADCSVLLRFVEDGDAEIEAYRQLAESGAVDGVIVSDLRHDDRRIPILDQLGLSAVTLNEPDVPSSFAAVCDDEEAGVNDAIEHLVERGYSRIAFVGGPDQYLHVRRRRAAWEKALAARGLSAEAYVESDFTASCGAEATERLLLKANRPDAIIYANDAMAVAGLKVALAAGLDVPGEIALVGFDDSELAEHLTPSLTSVRTDPFGWGIAAARALLEDIESSLPSGRRIHLDPPRLVVRGSTARLSEGVTI